MTRKIIIASAAVFFAWAVLDFIIHGMLLKSAYDSTEGVFRAPEEMKMGLIYFAVLVSAIAFVYIYAAFFANKGMNTALKYGIIFGLGAGISMGYGSYASMQIDYYVALTWFLGTLVEAAVGGILVGLLVKEDAPKM